jgi:tetratricopeptide (TPR) repeat protein
LDLDSPVVTRSWKRRIDRKNRHDQRKTGKVRKLSRLTDHAGWGFARLLDWHLARGTRPTASLEQPGKQWSSKELSQRIGVDERTVRNWRRGRNSPDEIASIERELFGSNSTYAAWMEELRERHLQAIRRGQTSEQAPKLMRLPYPSLGSLFKGRNDTLTAIHKSLTRNGLHWSGLSVTVLFGLGGVGKTRAAVEYGWAHSEQYSTVLFIRATSPTALEDNFAALVGPSYLHLKNQTANVPLRITAVQEWLRTSKKWLLIVDGIDSPDLMRTADRLLHTVTGGHVLITARLSTFAGHIDAIPLIEIGVDDSIEFLLDRTDAYRMKHSGDAETCFQIARDDLGCLPLALEQAAAYIAKNRLTFLDYRTLWQRNWEKVAEWADERLTNYPRSLAATWQTSVDQLSKTAKRLLSWLSWLAPSVIPSFMFDVPGIERDNLTELLEYSLIRPEAAGFAMHRLLQEVTRRGLPSDQKEDALFYALLWVHNSMGSEDVDIDHPNAWAWAEQMLPHIMSIVSIGQPRDEDASKYYVSVVSRAGYTLYKRGLYAAALLLLNRAVEVAEAQLGDHILTISRLNCLGDLQEAIKEFERGSSLPIFQRALAISERILDSEHRNLADSLHNVAFSLQMRGDPETARPLLERALAIREKALGPEHPHTHLSRTNLAVIHLLAGDTDTAERILSTAIEKLREDHPITALTLSALAGVLDRKGQHARAKKMRKQAISICMSTLGPDHPWTKNLKNPKRTFDTI